MDVENAAAILAGSILTGLSFIVVVITIVVINNIFSRYWLPIKWVRFEEYPPRYADEIPENKVDIK
jgi:hypothetical protein